MSHAKRVLAQLKVGADDGSIPADAVEQRADEMVADGDLSRADADAVLSGNTVEEVTR